LKKIFKKLLPAKIHLCAYIFRKNVIQNNYCLNYTLKVFTGNKKSGIKKIDSQISNNNECYAVFDDDKLIHATWVFKRKLLTSQLGIHNVYTAGDSYTIESYRGQGIYTNILKLISSEKEKDIIIFVDPNNLSSIRGIEKAGFSKLYEFILIRFLGLKIRLMKL
jgi:hypothetical protein